MVKIFKFFSIMILLSSVLSGCNGDNNKIAIESCINRGIAYFKTIGSYPNLLSEPNAGRSAEIVAYERCNRTTTAF